MRRFLRNSAVVIALAGAALVTVGAAQADGFMLNVGSNRGHGTAIAVGFSDNNVAFAYRDGYWDRGHSWHRWNNDRDYRNYRKHHASEYRDFNHDRDGGDGWRQGDNRGHGHNGNRH